MFFSAGTGERRAGRRESFFRRRQSRLRSRFTRAEIDELLQGRSASEMFSFRSPRFKALGSNQKKLADEDLVDLMLKEPHLIRRPVVRIDKKVYFGADSKILEQILK